MAYEAVIGVETHVELRTDSKMFCGCPTSFGAEPNTQVCPVCLGLPGALPVPNVAAIELTVTLGLALECRIAEHSVFHRKNYFYPDLPKNYQISQYDLPLCVGGQLDLTVDGEVRRVGITRVHLEEDTGKIIHVGIGGRIGAAEETLLDFNRSGVPLMEVVSEPDLRSPDEARAYALELIAILIATGVSDARLEEGSVRFDANVSMRAEDQTAFGTKVEIKNMNSTRSLQRALAFEMERQSGVLEEGGTIVQETRHWDEEAGRTRPGRSKEEASDYRYFSEPDLLPVTIDEAWRERLREGLPTLPAVRRRELAEMGADTATASVLVDVQGLADLYVEAVREGADAAAVANWLTGEVIAHLRRTDGSLADTALTPRHLVELEAMTSQGELSSTAAKEVLGLVMEGQGTPRQVAEARDLIQVSDAAALEPQVEAVLADHPEELARLEAGEQQLVGFFVGEVMKASGGKADPRLVSEMVRKRSGAG